jgi:hypothetical protein
MSWYTDERALEGNKFIKRIWEIDEVFIVTMTIFIIFAPIFALLWKYYKNE